MPRKMADRYEIERLLGRGGMSTVLAARDRTTGQAVAIKWLGDRGSPPPDHREIARFEQEARIASSLQSPHVGRVIEVDRDDEAGLPYLVMDLYDGEDAQGLIDRLGAIDPGAALCIARQACKGLSAAHAAGVVHRDVKPSNLFLCRRGEGAIEVKVLDFGVAKIRRRAPGGAIAAPVESMTKSGEMLGSPLYMSPEQVEASRHVDARSDVFSMGVVLYALITGRAPYAHIRSFVQLLYAIVNTPAPPLREVAPRAPADLAAVVDRAMQNEPADRFADAGALLSALEACAPEGDELREEMLVRGDPGAPAPPSVDPQAPTVRAERTSLWKRLFGTPR